MGLKYISCEVPAKKYLHAAPIGFNLYSTFSTIMSDPASLPNSGPALVHIFLQYSAFKYVSPILRVLMSNPFNAAIRNTILTISLDKIEEYVVEEGGLVVCPPATNRDLRMNLLSIFISKMRWHIIC